MIYAKKWIELMMNQSDHSYTQTANGTDSDSVKGGFESITKSFCAVDMESSTVHESIQVLTESTIDVINKDKPWREIIKRSYIDGRSSN